MFRVGSSAWVIFPHSVNHIRHVSSVVSLTARLLWVWTQQDRLGPFRVEFACSLRSPAFPLGSLVTSRGSLMQARWIGYSKLPIGLCLFMFGSAGRPGTPVMLQSSEGIRVITLVQRSHAIFNILLLWVSFWTEIQSRILLAYISVSVFLRWMPHGCLKRFRSTLKDAVSVDLPVVIITKHCLLLFISIYQIDMLLTTLRLTTPIHTRFTEFICICSK